MKEETTPASVEEILLRNGFDILENGCCYTDIHRIERAMQEYSQAKDKEIEGLKTKIEKLNGCYSEKFNEANKLQSQLTAKEAELKYYRELAGDLLKICEMVHVPQILREYPHVLAGKPTNKDIQWAKEKIEALKNQKSE